MKGTSDTYRTIIKPSPEIIFKEKKSKFYGYAFPINSENDVKPLLEELRKKHHTANHICYAWQIGAENMVYRANDDGEPHNSAGIPIFGQINSYDVTNILVAVVRIFGGTKLGVGGLISAYKTTAQMTLEASHFVERFLGLALRLTFKYPEMDKVIRIIKQNNLQITSQKIASNCEYLVMVRKNEVDTIMSMFLSIRYVKLKIED